MAMVALVVVFAAGSGAAPSKVARLATTPTTTTDCEGHALSGNPYLSTDLLNGSNFEIDAAIPPPSTAKKGTLPTGGSNQVVNHPDCLDWKGLTAGSFQQAHDALNGSGDDAFCKGTSENDTTPCRLTLVKPMSKPPPNGSRN